MVPEALSASRVFGMAVHPFTHELYGVLGGPGVNGGLVRIDKATVPGTLIAPTARMSGLAFDPETATLFGVDNGLHADIEPEALYTVDLVTGATTLVGRPGVRNPLGLEFLPEPEAAALGLVAALGLLARRRKQ